jgi:hypothetical protein
MELAINVSLMVVAGVLVLGVIAYFLNKLNHS